MSIREKIKRILLGNNHFIIGLSDRTNKLGADNLSKIGSKTPNDVLLVFMFLFISGFQSLLFAMWMDIQDNERLYK